MKKTTLVVFLLFTAFSPLLSAQAKAWQPVTDGSLPGIATIVGYTRDGAMLSLVRSVKSGVTSLGWTDEQARLAILIGNAKSASATSFEIYTGAGRWVHGDTDNLPDSFISAGTGADGNPVYILRVSSGGSLMPAIYSAAVNAAVAYVNGKRMLFSNFEVLVPDWGIARDSLGEAFQGGADSDGAILVPFRAAQGGGLHPGKYNAVTHQGYVSFGGQELEIKDPRAEVFIGAGVWTPARGGLPVGAIPAGYDGDGSTLYMIRADAGGAQSLGKYSDKRHEAYVPYGGAEVPVTDFEVLCYDFSRNRGESTRLAAAAPVAPSGPPPVVPNGAFPPPVNLIQNPSAEIQPVTQAGWTVASGDWTRPITLQDAGLDSIDGDHFFWPGKVDSGELYQDVSVMAYKRWLTQGVQASFAGYIAGYAGDPDTARVILEARDAGGNVLGTVDSGPQNNPSWVIVELAFTLPPTTAWIRVRLIGVRSKGDDDDAYFDKLSLVLTSMAPQARTSGGSATQDGMAPGASPAAGQMVWSPYNGATPLHSISMGMSPNGAILYLARAMQDGVTRIGFLDPRSRAATIFDAARIDLAAQFEVWAGGGRWVQTVVKSVPANALIVGTDVDGNPMHALRVSMSGWLVPAFYSPNENSFVAYVAGRRQLFGVGEVLVPDWADAADPGTWKAAFKAGSDADGSPLVPLRARRGKSLLPGKFRLADQQGSVAAGAREIPVAAGGAELFVGTGVWVKPVRAGVPDNAIRAGWDDNGSPLYMIRAKQNGADVLGLYSDVTNQALVTFAGSVIVVKSFEVLCYPTVTATAAEVPAAPAAQPAPQPVPAAPAPITPAAPISIATQFGVYHFDGDLGPADVQKDGSFAKIFLYDGRAGENLQIKSYGAYKAPQPGLQLVAPSGKMIKDDSAASTEQRSMTTPLAETGRYTIRVRNAGPMDYIGIALQGRGLDFTGTLNEKSPVGTDNVPYAPVTLTGFVAGLSSFIYVAEVSADTFAPTAVIVRKDTMAPLAGQSVVLSGNRATLTFFVDGYGDGFSPDMSLLLLVKPAKPGAARPKGTYKVNVRYDHAEGS